MPFAALAVALMLALSGSVAVAGSQPGDTLYEVKSGVNGAVSGSAHGLLQALHIESDTEASGEVHGSATSTEAHERTEARQDTRASGSVSAHGETRVRVDADHDGEDDGIEAHGSGIVNVQL